MRTIKFRGKRVDNGEWVYGYYINQYGTHSIYLPDGADGIFDAYHVIPETVGQFTGLTDENGAEIYDGDIFTTRNGYNYFVVFENGSFECCHCNHRDTVNGGMLRWGLLSRAYELGSAFTPKKIGNIHDNPELLK